MSICIIKECKVLFLTSLLLASSPTSMSTLLSLETTTLMLIYARLNLHEKFPLAITNKRWHWIFRSHLITDALHMYMRLTIDDTLMLCSCLIILFRLGLLDLFSIINIHIENFCNLPSLDVRSMKIEKWSIVMSSCNIF